MQHLLKEGAIKARRDRSPRENSQHLVMSIGARLQAVSDCKGFSSKNESNPFFCDQVFFKFIISSCQQEEKHCTSLPK